MKSSKKIISLLLAVVLALSTLPMLASASAIKNEYNTIEKLISTNSIGDLLEYLVNQINANADYVTAPVLRIVYLAMNNDDINAIIGTKEVTQLSKEEASKILVTWLDTKILPDLAADLEGNSVIQIINDNVPGLQVKLSSVQDVYDTLGQLDGLAIRAALNLLGDAKDIDVSSVKGVKVAGNEYGAVKALFGFLKDNMGVLKKLLNGSLDLGVLNNAVGNSLGMFTQLPQLIKSFIYKLIDSDAAAGEFKDGKMGGDWANSPYASYTADQMLAAALIKLINGTDDLVSKDDANKVLNLSFYGILAEYAKPVYAKFAVEPLNKAITWLNEWLSEQTNETLKAQFKTDIAAVTADTFNSVFSGVKDTGIIGQINNILVLAAKHCFSADTYAALKLEQGGNDKLNDNLTKVARYVIKLAQGDESFANMLHVPEGILAADADTLELSDMAYIILKPFFSSWFKNADPDVIANADTLSKLGVVAVYYTATNSDWLTLDYTFKPLTAEMLDGLDDAKASDLILEIAAGIGVGALKQNKEAIHFTADVDTSDWKKAVNDISNWGLDFIDGLPAAARVHDLKNANGYGPFYKLNVVLNELIDFSFLNNVSSPTFKLDLETLLKRGVLQNLYNCDVAGVLSVFQKNSKAGNILNGQLVPSVIGVVNRLVTGLFEHNCGEHATATDLIDDPANPCTQQIKRDYEYCTVCGAYFKYNETIVTKVHATHVFGDWETVITATGLEVTLATCNYKFQRQRVCEICGFVDKEAEKTGSHKWDDPKAENPVCVTCGKSLKELKGEVGPEYKLGDVDGDNKITAGDARLTLRRAVDLEDYAEGSAKFLACDIDKDGNVTAGDARIILRIAVELESIDDYVNA